MTTLMPVFSGQAVALMKKILLLLVLALGLTGALSAADFYVAPNGDDSNQGTKGKPFATLARATGFATDQVTHRFFKCGWASGGPAIYDAAFKPEWSLDNGAELSDGWALPDNGVVFSYSIRRKEAGIVRLGPDKQPLWKYIAPDKHDNHSCQPLPGGGFLAGETATNGM